MKNLRKHRIKWIAIGLLLIAYAFCLPKKLFKSPTSTVIEDRNGRLLGAKIAEDGQWRFPHITEVPEKFSKAIVAFEDRHFKKHPGFNPASIISALITNTKAGEVKRGGSTLTQQTIRLSRPEKRRSYMEKARELAQATRLELRHSKKEILALYSSNAPFGGNVVGLDAASWRYFGRPANELSWAEAATLAVLPNAPGLIHPGRNRDMLEEKRNFLLAKMLKMGEIDQADYDAAIIEPLPEKPHALPQEAPHLLERLHASNKGERITTSISGDIQTKSRTILTKHHKRLQRSGVNNGAVIIIDVNTRQVLAYHGNTLTSAEHHKDVDVIKAPRSTGSILKPFLYMAMLDGGDILPQTLVADVPTQIGNFTPKNYDKEYYGAVHADLALSRSLNIPSIRLLRKYGVARFKDKLNDIGLNEVKYNANYYGLSLILGGAESSLWDLAKAYSMLPATLNHYTDDYGKYYENELFEPQLLLNRKFEKGKGIKEPVHFSASSVWQAAEALKNVKRPNEEVAWEYFHSSKRVAWKTGTSFGNRDAWAIGFNANYLVAVWVGNADGEGRPNMTGVSSAAPIMFETFDLLPGNAWFEKPYSDLFEAEVCSRSGQLAGRYCETTNDQWIGEKGLYSEPCRFHKVVHVTSDERYRVNTSCADLSAMKPKTYFVLPPAWEWYYKRNNMDYEVLPPLKDECNVLSDGHMAFIFPANNAQVTIPSDMNGKKQNLVVKVAHKRPANEVFWYLNEEYVGSTVDIHEIGVQPPPGKHFIHATDASGEKITRVIHVD